jgi:HSP20 family molecular chaperone IbpA
VKISKLFRVLWGITDGFLLVTIFVLMAVLLLATGGGRGAAERGAESGDPDVEESRTGRRAVWTGGVNAAPVAYERNRSAQIARSMVVSESVPLPVRTAMDMREGDKSYEVRFALPSGACEEDLSLAVNGNILTLVMKTEERAFMKRIRIPCNYANNSALTHFVSNHVLYVQISTP